MTYICPNCRGHIEEFDAIDNQVFMCPDCEEFFNVEELEEIEE